MTTLGPVLLVLARTRVCSFPVTILEETLRCLPVQPFPGAPPFLLGLSVIRGEPTPVVDLGRMLGMPEEARPTRWVMLRVGGRRVALSVEEVLKIVPAESLELRDLPPLLRGAGAQGADAIASLDEQFVTVLDAARLVPDQVWSRLDPGGVVR